MERESVRGFGAGGLGLPTQNGLAGGADFIKAAYASGVRCGFDKLGVRRGFLGDRAHGVDKEVAFLAGF